MSWLGSRGWVLLRPHWSGPWLFYFLNKKYFDSYFIGLRSFFCRYCLQTIRAVRFFVAFPCSLLSFRSSVQYIKPGALSNLLSKIQIHTLISFDTDYCITVNSIAIILTKSTYYCLKNARYNRSHASASPVWRYCTLIPRYLQNNKF